MALLRGKYSEIPSDAVVLTPNDAVNYQLKIINNWKYKWDVAAIKYGGTILSSATALASIFIHTHYRNKFKLLGYGKISSYLPTVLIPTTLSFFGATMTLPNIILQDKCPTCIQMRSSALQSFSGLVLPTVLASLSALSLSHRYVTYDIPHIRNLDGAVKVFKLWQSKTKPIANILFAIFLGQALLASAVTYMQAQSVHTVNKKLLLFETHLEKSIEKSIENTSHM